MGLLPSTENLLYPAYAPRYLSPVGPLRLDLGVPLDRRPDDPTYKVYFGFGSVF